MHLSELLRDWRSFLLLGLFSALIVYYVFPLLLYLVFLLLTIILAMVMALLHHPGPYVRRNKSTFPEPPKPNIQAPLSRIKTYPPPRTKPTLISVNVDVYLQEVISLTLKHHVIPTYESVGWNQKEFFQSVMPEIWKTIGALFKRAAQMDTMKLVTQDVAQVLCSHFEQFRGIHYQDSQDPTKFPNLSLYPYLESPEHELNYLRQVSEVLLCTCLSRDLLECSPVRVLIREYLACQILLPTIEMLCDPDYINQKLLSYLVKREEATKSARKRPAYTDFEDFMKHVSKSEDVNELQQIRESIITDIIQAKAVYKMMSSRLTGLHGRQFPIPIPAEKVKSLMDRDLDVYITQLGTAKALSERQLRKLGVEDYMSAAVSTDVFPDDQATGRQLGIPFETIMKNEVARMYLFQFVDVCGFGSLVSFWVSVGDLANVPSSSLYKSLKSIYDEHLSPIAPGCLFLEDDVLKSITDTLETDSQACLSTLNKIRSHVYDEIYELFYQNFISSDYYKELMAQSNEGVFPTLESFVETSGNESMEDSQYKQKLHSLKHKLEEKDNELSLMPEEIRSSRSLKQRKKALEKDRTQLTDEIKKLEHYIDHTEEWFGTIGQWSIEVHSVDVSKEDNYDQNPLFVIVVHRPELSRKKKVRSTSASSLSSLEDLSLHNPHLSSLKEDGSIVDSEDGTGTASEVSDNSEGPQAGWVVGRHLSEFEELHEKVFPVCSNLKFPPLPKRFIPFYRPDAQSSYWTKYCLALQSYLNVVMQDDRLQESEEVFNFLSPVSDNLRKSSLIPREKRSLSHRLSLTVPSFPGVNKLSGGNKDHAEEGGGGKEDPIAEHMYLLVSEVFELDQWSRVLRKQLVELVQLTYGKSIDRQLQEFMSWVVSEPMLVFYLETFRDSMWPEGSPAPPAPTRSDTEKARTRDDAKKRFLKISPQALQTILGQRNCQIGFGKIFESMQDPRGNKQLFYSLLEIVLYAIVPELQTVEIDENGTDWKAL